MKLYHYTGAGHLSSILADQVLRVTESNVGSGRPDWPPYGEHVGPDVVWLTTSPNGKGQGLEGDGGDKTLIRITVDVGDAEPWSTWSAATGIHRAWREAFERGKRASTWWVVARPIPSWEWTAVEQKVVRQNKRAVTYAWVPAAAADFL